VVPLYATAYLNLNDVDDSLDAAVKSNPTQARTLRTCFTQPGVLPDFLEKLHKLKVTLRNKSR